MAVPRSKFIPHWLITSFIGLFGLTFLTFSVKEDLLEDPALVNIIKNFSFLLLIGLYFLWFMIRSAVALKFRLILLGIVLSGGVFFFTQYKLVGWSGLLDPEFERKGSRDHKNADSLTGFIYNQGAKIEGVSFNQFLGSSDRSGIVEGAVIYTDWNNNSLTEVWRRKIGEGLSGFVVQGDYAITMEQRGPFELVVCYDTKTGQPRWAHREENRHESDLGGVGPRATVAIDGDKVYAVGAFGRLACLNIDKGTVVWKKDILSIIGSDLEHEKAKISWGRSGSVLIVGEKLIVPGGGKPGECVSLLAFSKSNGELLWKGGEQQISYASPQLLTISGVEQIVTNNESSVSGHSIEDGKELWRVELPGKTNANANCSQVRVVNDKYLFMSKAYHTGSKLIELSLSGDEWSTKQVWLNKRVMRTKFSSPIHYDETSIVGLDERDLQAIDAMTGKEIWEGERYGYGQILKYNDYLMVLSERGELALVDLSSGKELSRLKVLNGKTWCTIAVAGPYILVRNNTEAACFKLPLKP